MKAPNERLIWTAGMNCISEIPSMENDEIIMPVAVERYREHLNTDHLIHQLGHRAISGGIVTAVAQCARFLLNIASAAILARLLHPEEFGLVGMVLAVVGFLKIFKEAGLSTATVQKEVVTQRQVSNLFWINLGLGTAVFMVGIGIAPLVALFYRDARLVGIMIALSFMFPIAGAAVQHQALLIRQMRFKAIASIDIVSMAVSILVGCGMAILGMGYWSLVGMQLGSAGCALIATVWVSGWKPARPSRNSGVMPLLRFGAHLTVSDFIGLLTANSDSVLLGRFFGARPLGLYSRASALLARPLEQLLAPISSVLVPVLSRLQADPERYRRTFMRAFDILALVCFPFAAICMALSKPIVLLVLGSKWQDAIPLFAGFSLLAVSLPLSIAPNWLFTSQGRGQDLLHTYIIAGALTVVAYLMGLRWGAMGVVWTIAAVSLTIRLPIIYYLAGRKGPVRSSDLWIGFLSHLPCWAGVLAGAAIGRALMMNYGVLMQLIVGAFCGLVFGIGVTFALKRPRNSALYAWENIRKVIARPQTVMCQ
jgi:O-antigen/teichoic acid export membrane protein